MAEEKNVLEGRKLSPQDINKLLNAQISALQAQSGGQRKGPSFDTTTAISNRAIDADPDLARRLALHQSRYGYSPGGVQLGDAFGDTQFLDRSSFLQMPQAQASAPQQASRSVGTGPGPFGGAMAPGNSAEALRAIRMRELEDAMRQAELTRNNDNRGFAQSREGRSQGAYEMLMRLLPKFMGRV